MLGDHLLAPAAAAFLEVGTFVGAALAGFGLLRWRLGDGLTSWLENHRRRGPVVGALLGAFPGCGGAIVVMPLYLRGQVSFGTVIATLTATMGDSSFVLLAADPRLALAVHLGLVVVGIGTGALVDRLGIAPRRTVPAPTVHLVPRRMSTVGAAAAPRGITGRPQPGAVPWGTLAFWSLTGAAFVVAVPTVLQLVDPARLELAGVPTTLVLGGLGAVASFAITGRARHGHHAGCVPEPDDLRAVFTQAGTETARITCWVVVAFVGYEVVVATTGWDVGAMPTIGLLGVVVAALLGLLPGCGPQLVLTGLYAQGALPFSVLAANALSQDGDALIPLLAADRRAAVVASVITVVPGLAVGAVLVGFGL